MALDQIYFDKEELEQEILGQEKLEEIDNQMVMNHVRTQEMEIDLEEMEKDKLQKEMEEMDNQEERIKTRSRDVGSR